MEWLGVLLLYLISGFIKKREQIKKRKEIESDPAWENGNNKDIGNQKNNLNQLFNNLFNTEELLQEFTKDINDEESEVFEEETEKLISNANQEDLIKADNSPVVINKDDTSFKDNIYHSKLSEKDEQHLGNKWNKKVNLKLKLFSTRKSIRKSIIVKEILDKPIALRN